MNSLNDKNNDKNKIFVAALKKQKFASEWNMNLIYMASALDAFLVSLLALIII